MSRSLAGLGLMILLLIALLASAPARLIVHLLPADAVIMQGVQGTLWSGQATRVLVASGSGYLHLGQMEWRLRPLSLLLFSPQLDLDSRWGLQRFAGSVKFGGSDVIELEDVDAVLDARLLRQYVPLELAGSVSLQLQYLTIEAGLSREGKGRLVWQDGGWVSPQGQRPLGSYALDFTQQQGEPLNAQVITLEGDVHAEGSIQLLERNYDIDIRLDGPGLDDPQLRQALQLLAAPQGDGFRVKLAGDF